MNTALLEAEVDPDPLRQLRLWLGDAQKLGLREPSAMTLATAARSGNPSARIVLLKEISEEGLLFFTNYESRKGSELDENPAAALLFYWDPIARQVRIEGSVVRTSREESERYFRSRPRESRVSAWASKQSAVIRGRPELEAEARRFAATFGDEEIPLPPFWGGYRLVPVVFEFWQGRENRLHDRIRYSRSGSHWTIERLAP